MNKQKQAFTLVELIVVITILAILGTIAFISLQGYSSQARDSSRISDVSRMNTALELFNIDAGKYPLPDNNSTVSYSGEILRYQGIFGTIVKGNVSKLDKLPLDPSTDKEYVYSVSGKKNSYQILNLLEGDVVLNTNVLTQTNAATVTRTAKVGGVYNEVFVKTANYIVPTPSLITSEDITGGITLNSTNIKSQVITGGKNIPKTGNVTTSTGGLNIGLSVYNGTINKDSTDQQKIDAMKAIQGAYSGSTMGTSGVYKTMLEKTTDSDILAISKTIISDEVGTTVTSTVVVVDPGLYDFTSYTFTTCGQTGNTGPSLSACTTSYTTTWDNNTAFYNMTTNGIQEWTVPVTGIYRINVKGAKGGNGGVTYTGGAGAIIQGDVSLTKGEKIKILVGQIGAGTYGGGGGGSFVTKSDNTPLIVAGGGGTNSPWSATNDTAKTTTTGGNGSNGVGGTNGGGGSGYNGSPGGAGLTGNGTASTCQTSVPLSFINGGVGSTNVGNQYGGFGGGSATDTQCAGQSGAGGGYSGGGASAGGATYGGGGGSYNSGTNQLNYIGNAGAGSVTITKGGLISCSIGYTLVNGFCNLDNNFPGSLLITASQGNSLGIWYGDTSKVWTLCYRASTDGTSSTTFHTNCNNKGPTISIYKFGTNLVGGYGSDSWTSSSSYKNNSSSWLFNLNTGIKQIVNAFPVYAQYDHVSYMPTFGGGHDLYCGTGLTSCYGNTHSYSPNPVAGYTATTASDLEVWY